MGPRLCVMSKTLRRELREQYAALDELKYLEASPDGVKYVEYEIVALHESVSMHESNCVICDSEFSIPKSVELLCPTNLFSEPSPISFRQDPTRAILATSPSLLRTVR
jgi:hypothetical protein